MTTDPAGDSNSAALRAATHESHARLEQQLAPVWANLDLQRYVRLLEQWYGFVARWESSAAFGGELQSFFDARRKRELLIADLVACGRSPEQIERLPLCPADALPFNEPPAALGILYVIEGSSLGGQIIAKQVREKLGFTPETGVAYFSSRGRDVMGMWRETKKVLDAPPFPAEGSRIVFGAVAAFDFLGEWLTTG